MYEQFTELNDHQRRVLTNDYIIPVSVSLSEETSICKIKDDDYQCLYMIYETAYIGTRPFKRALMRTKLNTLVNWFA